MGVGTTGAYDLVTFKPVVIFEGHSSKTEVLEA
jgi:hypothetical protein